MQEENKEKKDNEIFSGLKKENNFQVPEGYFEKLPLQIQKRISDQRPTSVWSIFEWLVKPQVALVASMVVAVLVIGIIVLRNQSQIIEHVAVNRDTILPTTSKEKEELKQLASNLKKEEVKPEHIEMIEEEVVIEEIHPEALAMAEKEIDKEKTASKPAEEINYLMENDVDLSLIIDELTID